LQQTKWQGTIYANVTMDMKTIQSCYDAGGFGASCRTDYFGMDFLPPVQISTEDIEKKGKMTPETLPQIIHQPVTYSFPVAVPSKLVLPGIRVLHSHLARAKARLGLMVVGGKSAGELVAFDQLHVAEQATDYSANSIFSHTSNTERWRLTVDALNMAIDLLEPPARANPDLMSLNGLLRTIKLMLDGLSNQWAAMVS
jgi:hypothetical protein